MRSVQYHGWRLPGRPSRPNGSTFAAGTASTVAWSGAHIQQDRHNFLVLDRSNGAPSRARRRVVARAVLLGGDHEMTQPVQRRVLRRRRIRLQLVVAPTPTTQVIAHKVLGT